MLSTRRKSIAIGKLFELQVVPVSTTHDGLDVHLQAAVSLV
jgi:hypothetical protein